VVIWTDIPDRLVLSTESLMAKKTAWEDGPKMHESLMVKKTAWEDQAPDE
jgi:hypothetical protein